MLGKRSDQKGLWEADRLYLNYVGKDTFYGLLASLWGQLFSDDDFAEIYCDFVFNTAHIETGRNCTLSKKGLHTWRLGDVELPNLEVAKAIAASSACPPAFPAVTLDLDASSFVKTDYADLFHRDDLKRRVSLTDGGAYDNLGIHAIRDCPTILVSDGSAPLRPTHGKRFVRQFNHRIMRPMETSLEQTRAIRRREVVRQRQSSHKGGHCGIRTPTYATTPFRALSRSNRSGTTIWVPSGPD